MSLTPIVSVINREIDYMGGYYKRDLLLEVVENIVGAITRHCLINVTLVDTLLRMYNVDADYKKVIMDVINTHLGKVSKFVLDDPANRLVHIYSGYLPEEFVFEVTTNR